MLSSMKLRRHHHAAQCAHRRVSRPRRGGSKIRTEPRQPGPFTITLYSSARDLHRSGCSRRVSRGVGVRFDRRPGIRDRLVSRCPQGTSATLQLTAAVDADDCVREHDQAPRSHQPIFPALSKQPVPIRKKSMPRPTMFSETTHLRPATGPSSSPGKCAVFSSAHMLPPLARWCSR